MDGENQAAGAGGKTYAEECADDGEDDNGKDGHDNAAEGVSNGAIPEVRHMRGQTTNHDHAFIAETTGFILKVLGPCGDRYELCDVRVSERESGGGKGLNLKLRELC